MFANKDFINTGAYISKSKRYYNAKPSAYYFYMRTKIPLNFCICISIPLRAGRVVSQLDLMKLVKVTGNIPRANISHFFSSIMKSLESHRYKQNISFLFMASPILKHIPIKRPLENFP